MQNGQFFPQNALFIHFSYEYRTFLIHSKIHSIVRQKYSFKEFIHSIVRKKYLFKECIHSNNNLIIHSMKIFIFLKNAVSATPTWHEMMIEDCRVSPGCKQGPVCETSWWLKASPSPLASASSTSLSWSSSSNFFSSSHTKEALWSTSIIVTLSSKCTWTKVTCDLRHSSLPVGRISCCVTTCNSQIMYFHHFSSTGF